MPQEDKTPSISERLDTAFGKYMEADGNVFTIRIGKTPIKVRNDDFELLKSALSQLMLEVIGEDESATKDTDNVELQDKINYGKYMRNCLRIELRAKVSK